LEAIIKLLAGGTCKVKELFDNADYEECGSISLGMDEDKFGLLMGQIGEDYELVEKMRAIYDWSVLIDALGDETTISDSKVKVYEQHKEDLAFLKYIIKKYKKGSYATVFRIIDKNQKNYVSYSYHIDGKDTSALHNSKANREDFCKFILGVVKDIVPDTTDKDAFDVMIQRLELRTFMPKQKSTDNRVIPYQLYQYELHRILETAEKYLVFLKDTDEDGISVSDKIKSIFKFRIPYYVGPLSNHSEYAWVVRKAGKILPWNFEIMVDLDASEEAFIKKLTNKCSYLPGEDVLPKDSLCYHKFMVLNEINNLRINNIRISVELKQVIYNELFLRVKKVTRKKLVEFLICKGCLEKDNVSALTGIDEDPKSNLTPQIAFRSLLSNGILSEEDVERIIERSSYAEDKSRLTKWIRNNYPKLEETDVKYITGLKFHDFGRLSRRFLTGFEGTNKETGEVTTVLAEMWNSQNNLMELLSDRYTFAEELAGYTKTYYTDHKVTLEDRLDAMYLSNSVKRSVYRTLDIVKDIRKAFGEPSKIFVEMARGASEDQKGKRTKSRKQQILEFYEKCKDEDVKELKSQLEAMGTLADQKLQGDKLFLYYMQLGKSMYSGKPIVLENLGEKFYDIDHIYPQAYVKDDSIINNKVLVLSSENGDKSDEYPIKSEIRHNMRPSWEYLRAVGLISEEKFKRLTRATPFSDEERLGFINRQLIETSQSTKAVAMLLKERFPGAEIIYCKARITSDFRHEFEIWKSRIYNDLHHAVDAYLNIVTGNVYDMMFSKNWFKPTDNYSIKTKTIFTRPLVRAGRTVWDGQNMLAKVKRTAEKNTAHFTKYAYFKHGGLFDQNIMPASEGLIPVKKGRDTTKYGGYNKAGTMFFVPVKYSIGQKMDVIIMSVEAMFGKRFLTDESFAKEYTFIHLKKILGKEVRAIEFPMGMTPWKVNTMLSFNGLNFILTGSSSGGSVLLLNLTTQFSAAPFWKYYVKKLEMAAEKLSKNPNYVIDPVFDKITSENNNKIYDLYIDKLSNSIYAKRMASPLEILITSKEKFLSLSLSEQTKALLNIHQVFCRLSGGTDLTLIGGSKNSAITKLSSSISNWKKSYSEVKILNLSASGLWKTESGNLLDLL